MFFIYLFLKYFLFFVRNRPVYLSVKACCGVLRIGAQRGNIASLWGTLRGVHSKAQNR